MTSTTLTREEYQRYLKTKEKLLLRDIGTQTDNLITKYNKKVFSSSSESATSSETETSSESDDITTSTTSQTDEYNSSSSNSSNDDDYDTESEEDDKSPPPRGKRKNRTNDDLKRVREIFDEFKKRRYVNMEDQDYYMSLKTDERKEVAQIEDELYNSSVNKTPLRFKIIQSNIDTKLKQVCLKKLDQLDNMSSHSDEYFKLLQWVESVAMLPINKYKSLPISATDSVEDISRFLANTRAKLDENVYGHKDTKEHIIRLLAKWISNKDAKGLVIGLEGSMGTGKTSLCLEVCNALGLPSGFVSLGGLSSSEYLVGHSYTYEGSRWGKIAEILMHAEYSNPVLYFDELDKVSSSRHGEEIINTLIHITDVTQNHNFRDKYFSEVPVDLSRCIIIFSYNDGNLVNPILKDRIVTIKASGYNQNDKIEICKKHMIPKILQEYAFKKDDIVFDDEIIRHIISVTDVEEGVRKLKRSLEDIVSNLNVHRLLKQPLFKKEDSIEFPLKVTEEITKKFITKKEINHKHHMMYI
jgi:ATP-dependent Lon protease